MLPASNRGAGQNIGFPDVCNTPVGPATVPIPYPNIAMNAQATGFSSVVKISMVNALNMASSIPMTSGDEAGVAHPTIKGAGKYTMGNAIVNIDRMPAINLTCPTTGNGMNNGVGAVLVPSAVNVTYCERSTRDTEDLDASCAVTVEDFVAAPAVAVKNWPGQVVHITVERLTDAALWPRLVANTKALVLDLRSCPGGDLQAARRLLSELLPKGSSAGELVQPDEDVTQLDTRRDPQCTLPLVVLVNRGTASAAEMLAATLQDHRRALIVGERTYGKLWAFELATDDDGCLQPVVVGRWRRPERAANQHRVVPDVPCSRSEAPRLAWCLALQLVAESVAPRAADAGSSEEAAADVGSSDGVVAADA